MFGRIRPNLTIKRLLSLKSFDSHIAVDIDGNTVTFNNVFLRDACNTPQSVDPSSKQKSFTTASISNGLSIKEEPTIQKENGEDVLNVVWEQNGKLHESKYPESTLRKYASLPQRFKGKFFPEEQIYWTQKDILPSIEELHVNYDDYLNDDGVFRKVLNNLNRFGLSFINNIEDPKNDPQLGEITEQNENLWPVSRLASRFGYIKKTFYGTLFDVKNKKDAINIAYTNVFLPLHMDLCYYESPPGLQLLHAIDNSTLGGENVFADSFAGAKHVQKVDPAAYEALKTVPITYHYNNNNEYYYYLRPLVVEDPYVKDFNSNETLIKEVNYSPPFQGPFEFHVTAPENQKLFDDFLRGFRIFEDFVNDPKNQYQVKTPEGSCVIFDNRRTLHSRLEFSDSNGGDRWLMGCYVDGDSYRSKLRKLH